MDNPELAPGQKLSTADGSVRLPLFSVVQDEHGIGAVKLWSIGASQAHWVDDTGTSYSPVFPVTILSVPSAEAKESAPKGCLLDKDARRYWGSQSDNS